jgi:hypothetical protein
VRKPAGSPASSYQFVDFRNPGAGAAPFTLTDATLAADGPYDYAARQVKPAGGFSTSGSILVTIDRTAPLVSPLTLLDDTGFPADGKTSNHQPRFSGNTEPNSSVVLRNANGQVLGSTTADATGAFVVQANAVPLFNGTYTISATAQDRAGNTSPPSPTITIKLITVEGDYDGDGKADLAVFRTIPSTGQALWYVQSLDGAVIHNGTWFGLPGDIPVPADFDGDGKTDLAVYRPNSLLNPAWSSWLVAFSSGGFLNNDIFNGQIFGLPTDVPVPSDFDGDGKADVGVYRHNSLLNPAWASWLVSFSSGGYLNNDIYNGLIFGLSNDNPVPADYDGDGKADYGVHRPNSFANPNASSWLAALSNGGYLNNDIINGQLFGTPTDIPTPGLYDGDSKADLAYYRPGPGTFGILQSATGTQINPVVRIGTDIPVAVDYDGDGKHDPATYRAASPLSSWAILRSTQGPTLTPFGQPGDLPLPTTPAQRAALVRSATASAASQVAFSASLPVTAPVFSVASPLATPTPDATLATTLLRRGRNLRRPASTTN